MTRSLLFIGGLLLAKHAAAFNPFLADGLADLAKVSEVPYGCMEALSITLSCDSELFTMAKDKDTDRKESRDFTKLCTSDCRQSVYEWKDDVRLKCGDHTTTIEGEVVAIHSIVEWHFSSFSMACETINTTDNHHRGHNKTTLAGGRHGKHNGTNWTTHHNGTHNKTAPFPLDHHGGRHNGTILPPVEHHKGAHNRTNPGKHNNITHPHPVCSGQVLKPGEHKRIAHFRNPRLSHLNLSNSTSCNQLSKMYGLTTGDLHSATNGTECTFSKPMCLPAACELYRVPKGATCDTLVEILSANGSAVTTSQLQSWNPNLIGACDEVKAGQYICSGAPKAASNSTEAHPRPSDDRPSSTPHFTNTTIPGSRWNRTSTHTNKISTLSVTGMSAKPSATQFGIIASCSRFDKPASGDTCATFAQTHQITPAQLYTWNPLLGADGSLCSTKFQTDSFYCVGTGAFAWPSITASASGSKSNATMSTRWITRTVSYRNHSSSSSATSIASSASSDATASPPYDAPTSSASPTSPQSVTTSSSSSTSSPAASASATATTTNAAPSPLQAGTVRTCTKYAKAEAGDMCVAFAARHGIAPELLYRWNPALGDGGAACADKFWRDTLYCVAA